MITQKSEKARNQEIKLGLALLSVQDHCDDIARWHELMTTFSRRLLDGVRSDDVAFERFALMLFTYLGQVQSILEKTQISLQEAHEVRSTLADDEIHSKASERSSRAF